MTDGLPPSEKKDFTLDLPKIMLDKVMVKFEVGPDSYETGPYLHVSDLNGKYGRMRRALMQGGLG